MSESNEVNRPTEGPRPHEPVSAKKLAANRRSAQRSTGPRTAQGKAAVRHNAVKHGLLAKEVLARSGDDTEDRGGAFMDLLEGLIEDLCPVGELERQYVDRIAMAHWRLGRARSYEAAQISLGFDAVGAKVRAHLDLDALMALLADLRSQWAAGASLSDVTLTSLKQSCGGVSEILDLVRAVQTQSSALAAAKEPLEQEELRQKVNGAVEALLGELGSWESEIKPLRRLMAKQLEFALDASAIPNPTVVEHLARYETMSTRQLDRLIDQLERLQRRRRAEDFAKQSHGAGPGSAPTPALLRAVTEPEAAGSPNRVRSKAVSATG